VRPDLRSQQIAYGEGVEAGRRQVLDALAENAMIAVLACEIAHRNADLAFFSSSTARMARLHGARLILKAVHAHLACCTRAPRSPDQLPRELRETKAAMGALLNAEAACVPTTTVEGD
jgi:hypothetical protein